MVAVFGAMQDKDLPAMLSRLRQAGAPVIFSRIDWHRAADPSELANAYGDRSQVASSPSLALAMARQQAGKDGIVLVCGSIYLAGEAMLAVAASRAHPRPAPHARPRR
jgi:dihydrofolate synthase/folylpolyglutamate synthase